MLAYGISQELSLQLYDVESAYFNANLEEEIYVQDPILAGQKAWKLRKALYGLKQSAKACNDLLKNLFRTTGYAPTHFLMELHLRQLVPVEEYVVQ